MKFLYADSVTGLACIIIAAPKEQVEKTQGPLTDKQYRDHVIKRSLTDQGITEYREISDEDIPSSREFRDAWVDVTQESRIDICCEKAKDIQLNKMRIERDRLLKKSDESFVVALSKGEPTEGIALEKQRLRELTDPLKNLDVTGKVNDDIILGKIKELGQISSNS